MSLNGSGVFVVSSAGQPVVAGTLISATVFNAFTADVATAISTAVMKDGQQTMTANLPMGGFKLTGLAAGTNAGDSVRYEQVGPVSAAGRALIDDADVAAQRATLGLGDAAVGTIGVNVQAYDANTAKLNVAQTFTAKQTFSNTVKLDEVFERVTITASAPTGTFDCMTQGIEYFTSNASANWTQNFRGDGSNTLNSQMAIGESITVTILATMTTTGYLPTALRIDGTATGVTLKYSSTWTADASCINAFTYTIIKTADATFTVLATKTKYA